MREFRDDSAQNLSRDSAIDQRFDGALPVQGLHGGVDAAIESSGVGEGLVGEMMRFEIVPDNLDVVELRRVLGQPLDGEPVSAGLKRRERELADVDRTVVLDEVSEAKPGQSFALVMDTRPCPGAARLALGRLPKG